MEVQEIHMQQLFFTTPPRVRGQVSPVRIRMNVDVPQPSPDVVPLPPSPHQVPPSPVVPPEITEPTIPGQHEPVREPVGPTTVPYACLLQ
jgi:hypothetical protein